MFELLNSEVKPLTMELAKQFSTMESSPTERGLNEKRIEYLTDKAKSGEFLPCHWATAKLGDKILRVNGFHSSTMLTKLDGSFPNGLQVHIDNYVVKDLDELALLFRQFDPKASVRSSLDICSAYQGCRPELSDVPCSAVKLTLEGVSWYRRTVEGSPALSGDDRYSLCGEIGLHSFLHWTGELLSMKTPEMKKLAIIAAMYATFITNEAEARIFWGHVARGGVPYDEAAPASVLDLWLKAVKERESSKPIKLKAPNFYQGCIFAWNAYREGKQPPRIQYDAKKGWLEIAE
jgi:hypothetical protein